MGKFSNLFTAQTYKNKHRFYDHLGDQLHSSAQFSLGYSSPSDKMQRDNFLTLTFRLPLFRSCFTNHITCRTSSGVRAL